MQELSDAKLISEYKNCNSVKNKIKKLGDILNKYIDEETKQKIIQEYLLQLIPAGTKDVIRGNKFNKLVKQFITKLDLDTNWFEICFEKKCEYHITTEIPDWYILEKSTNKIIICNEIQFKNKNKAYKLFEIGFDNNLNHIIISFFQ